MSALKVQSRVSAILAEVSIEDARQVVRSLCVTLGVSDPEADRLREQLATFEHRARTVREQNANRMRTKRAPTSHGAATVREPEPHGAANGADLVLPRSPSPDPLSGNSALSSQIPDPTETSPTQGAREPATSVFVRPVPRDATTDHDLGTVWAQAVGEATGHACVAPRRGELQKLLEALDASLGPVARFDARRAWLVDHGRRFGEQHRDTGKINVHAFADWVSGGCKPRTRAGFGPKRVTQQEVAFDVDVGDAVHGTNGASR